MLNCMSTDAQFLIYALHHPESMHVYVGQSARGMKRPREHNQPVTIRRNAHYPKTQWIQSLKKRGLEPEIVILEECSAENDLNDAERFFIAYFRALGMSLLNVTDGGEAGAEISRRYWADPEARKKKSIQQTGKTHGPETRAKLSADRIGVKKTPEQRANMATAAKSRWAIPGYREKQIEVQKISHSSEEVRAQAAENAKLASHDTHRSPEYRARQSEAQKILCASDEVRARKSETTKRVAQDPAYRAKQSEARTLWWARQTVEKRAETCAKISATLRRNKKQDDK